jgi:hypothetical protein
MSWCIPSVTCRGASRPTVNQSPTLIPMGERTPHTCKERIPTPKRSCTSNLPHVCRHVARQAPSRKLHQLPPVMSHTVVRQNCFEFEIIPKCFPAIQLPPDPPCHVLSQGCLQRLLQDLFRRPLWARTRAHTGNPHNQSTSLHMWGVHVRERSSADANTMDNAKLAPLGVDKLQLKLPASRSTLGHMFSHKFPGTSPH